MYALHTVSVCKTICSNLVLLVAGVLERFFCPIFLNVKVSTKYVLLGTMSVQADFGGGIPLAFRLMG